MHQNESVLELCKLKHPPLSSKFKLIPSHTPLLAQRITGVNWNCVDKQLYIEVQETSDFEAYKWIESIKSSKHKKTDSLLLIFQDKDENDLSGMKFNGLKLVKHNCILSNNNMYDNDILTHDISIKYINCESISVQSEDDAFVFSQEKRNEIVDGEWQTLDYTCKP